MAIEEAACAGDDPLLYFSAMAGGIRHEGFLAAAQYRKGFAPLSIKICS
jgi:hypothetical protein